jgi:hypothetical protein
MLMICDNDALKKDEKVLVSVQCKDCDLFDTDCTSRTGINANLYSFILGIFLTFFNTLPAMYHAIKRKISQVISFAE